MRRTGIVTATLAMLLGATPAIPQTAAERLQKGIYTQDTTGDLDGAIAIYRQIVSSGSSPRDVAAQAQYRLAQSLIQKGDLGNAAQEFDKLARSYADYGRLVSSLASEARAAAVGRGGLYYSTGNSAEDVDRAIDRVKEEMVRAQQLLDRTRKVELPNAKAGFEDARAKLERALADLRARGGNTAELAAQLSALEESGNRVATMIGPVERQLEEQRLQLELARPEEGQAANRGDAKQAKLLASLEATLAGRQSANGNGDWASLARMNFDGASPVTVSGKINDMVTALPSGYVKISGSDGRQYTFLTSTPAETQKQGLTMGSAFGSDVIITGLLAQSSVKMLDGSLAASATTITLASGRTVFDRALIAPATK